MCGPHHGLMVLTFSGWESLNTENSPFRDGMCRWGGGGDSKAEEPIIREQAAVREGAAPAGPIGGQRRESAQG